MNIRIITLLVLLFSINSRASTLGSATGIEAGFGKVSRDSQSATGTSWMYHFEVDVDNRFNFFGQAGQTRARKPGTNLTQTTFAGGLGLDLIPSLVIRVGAALTDTHGKDALGGLLGFAFKIPAGVFVTGPSVTYIKTPDDESAALRWMLLLQF